MTNLKSVTTESQNGRIDVHHHILPAEYVSRLKEIGITTAIGREFPQWSPKKSLDFMKKNGSPLHSIPRTFRAEFAFA